MIKNNHHMVYNLFSSSKLSLTKNQNLFHVPLSVNNDQQ